MTLNTVTPFATVAQIYISNGEFKFSYEMYLSCALDVLKYLKFSPIQTMFVQPALTLK